MAKNGNTDKDMGLADIFKEMDKLKSMAVKVGIPEGSGEHDGIDIAQYAAINEFGTATIPARDFIRTTIDSNREKIQAGMDRLVGQVASGKSTADIVTEKLGIGVSGMVRHTIRHGDFVENAKSTKARKHSSKPLIDTGTMRDSVGYVVIKNNSEIKRGKATNKRSFT
jgi:HK97 gp10 family phage protein